jgi:signal transduction histidine kinase
MRDVVVQGGVVVAGRRPGFGTLVGLPSSWWAACLGLALLGSVVIGAWGLDNLRAAFEADARIVHRLLSQRAAQHDAILATLNLLQAGVAGEPGVTAGVSAGAGGAAAGPEQRLPALYPQLLAVYSRGRDQAWPVADLQAAELESRQLRHAVLARVDLRQGRAVLLQAGEPASHALAIDLSLLVSASEWPAPVDTESSFELRLVGSEAAWVLQPGRRSAWAWTYEVHKTLASSSQPFDLVARRSFGWAELPWLWMLGWCLASLAMVAGLHAWRAQVAARRRAEELVRLGQVARLNTLGELAAGMAHELNQPLTAVLASTQAAQRVLVDDPPDLDLTRQAMGHAVTQARRAREVLSRLRRMVERPDAARPTQSIVLADAAREVLELLAPELATRQVRVDLVALPDGGAAAGDGLLLSAGRGLATQVLADPVALQQIIHNLLMNALQALERVNAGERRIALQVGWQGRAQGRNASPPRGILVVADSGPGFSPEALPRLFEPFFSTRPGGLGLGLSLCETLALGMGGGLGASHNTPRGACFELSLPLVAQGSGADDLSSGSATVSPN